MPKNSRSARNHRRSFILGAIVTLLLSGLSLRADAHKPTTWIILDTDGHILSQHDPDALNYPASLTKMMTLFLTFDALEHHRIALTTEFPVSRHAAAQSPSKLGLRPGNTISVRDLILSVVTHSANDSAVVLAEGLGGSEAAFAVQMNHQARLLGMTRTNFRNASGLPNPFQYTTARDLSKLALALYRTFPREYSYFSTEEFTYQGHTYGTHNHLMSAFQGMDGIKTGFINASGFNLAASAVRNNRRLVGVIMGGRSAESRDMEMASLLDDAFAHRGSGTPAQAPVAIAANEQPPAKDPGPMPLRNGDSLSAIASRDVSATPLPPSAPVETAAAEVSEQPELVAHTTHTRHTRHHRQAATHGKLRHNVVLASTEESRPAPHVRTHHHATRHAAHHRKYVSRKHHQHVAARHHAKSHHYAAASTHHHNRAIRAASASKPAQSRHHGVACGGWNGNNQPCPQGLSAPRHDGVRSASRHAPQSLTSG